MDDGATIPVVIIGGALSGLSSAIFLDGHGVKSTIVERHPAPLRHPRLSGVNNRTLEIYRQFGLGETIADASDHRRLVFPLAETLNSEHWAFIDAGDEELSMIAQDELEAILHAEAERRGVERRFNTELISVDGDDHAVAVTVTDRGTGAETTLRADYVIAADGARSSIRRQLGIDGAGPGSIEKRLTVLFEADLSAAIRGRRLDFAHLNRPRPGAVIWPAGKAGRRWRFQIAYLPGESIADYPDHRLARMVREAVGLPDLELTFVSHVPGRDVKVLDFDFAATIATTFGHGRVFLVGDAAHNMPPTGGHGGNAGVHDAHNLAWKLAAVLHGRAGPELLDTYHAERHPVAETAMRQALAQMKNRFSTTFTGHEHLPARLPHAAVALSYQYRSRAVPGASDDTQPATLAPDELAGQPGTRAPELPIHVEGQKKSTLDLYGFHFAVLAGRDGHAWFEAARSLSTEFSVAIDAFRFGHEIHSTDHTDMHEAHGISADGALLVRPDGFVAWRRQHAAIDPARDLRAALDQILNL